VTRTVVELRAVMGYANGAVTNAYRHVVVQTGRNTGTVLGLFGPD
jgi:hypothetical protein